MARLQRLSIGSVHLLKVYVLRKDSVLDLGLSDLWPAGVPRFRLLEAFSFQDVADIRRVLGSIGQRFAGLVGKRLASLHRLGCYYILNI